MFHEQEMQTALFRGAHTPEFSWSFTRAGEGDPDNKGELGCCLMVQTRRVKSTAQTSPGHLVMFSSPMVNRNGKSQKKDRARESDPQERRWFWLRAMEHSLDLEEDGPNQPQTWGNFRVSIVHVLLLACYDYMCVYVNSFLLFPPSFFCDFIYLSLVNH